MQTALYHPILVNDHIVPQIVKSEFVVGTVSDITLVGFPTLVVIHIIQNAAHRQAQETVYLSHPLRVTAGQVVVDSDHMYALTLQRVQIRRKKGYLRLTFTGFHLRDSALMQDNTAHELYAEMLGMEHSPCRFPYYGICLRQKVIQCLPFSQSLFKLVCLGRQLTVAELLHCFVIALNLADDRFNPPDLLGARIAKDLFNPSHSSTSYLYSNLQRITKNWHYAILVIVTPIPISCNLYFVNKYAKYKARPGFSTLRPLRPLHIFFPFL